MALIKCDKHGETGFMPFVSKELSKRIESGEHIKHDDISWIDVLLIDDEDGEILQEIRYWMSTSFFNSISALKKYRILTEHDEKEVDRILSPIIKGGGCCGKCFDEQTDKIRLKAQ
ncbi:hypothetical protein R50073_30340 [Maricurvus nonylphenolicus]|uniref:hypothetical protein n=1 Tax=Maricurvus nonylphenolicus TaxID=1008307 RepID=UPI0036F3421A